MARERTGNVERFLRADGSIYYKARIRLGDGSRERVDIPARHNVDDAQGTAAEHRAAFAQARQEAEDRTGTMLRAKRKATEVAKPTPKGGLTCDDYATLVFAAREAEGKRAVGRERSLWRAWVSPRLGAKPIAAVTRDQIEDFRNVLDGQVKLRMKGTKHEGLASKSAMNVWTICRMVFKEAVSSRDRAMKIRTDDPTLGHKPPHRGAEMRDKTFWYPSELAAMLAHAGEPRAFREAIAVTTYLALRPEEARALTWGDVDFVGNIVHISKSYNEATRELQLPKTKAGRRAIPIEAALLPLLEHMHKRGVKATDLVLPVLVDVGETHRARRCYMLSRAAGNTRERLYASTKTERPIDFRSCRDTGATWMHLAGVNIEVMRRRLGHKHIGQTSEYVKMGEDLGGAIGTPFPPLPPDLVRAGAIGPSMGQVAAIRNETLENQGDPGWAERDSKTPEGSASVVPRRESAGETFSKSPETTHESDLAQSLAQSIAKAADAGAWDAVTALTGELRALRLAREGVADLEGARNRRGR